MKGRATTQDKDLGMEALLKRIRAGADHVDIGIHADEGELMVKIAAAHEFGALINHPGGTAYGYATAADAKTGKIKFLKGGSGFRVLGRTKPHQIRIPMRSFIRSTVDENAEKYHNMAQNLLRRVVSGDLDKHGALELAGLKIETDIKNKIRRGPFRPLALATIRRKKSDKPLIDKGHMLGAIRYVVGSSKEEPAK